MSDVPAAWAEWAAYQWGVVGRTQKQIGADLAKRSAAYVCQEIVKFLSAVYPQYVSHEWHSWGLIHDFGPFGEERKDLARKYFATRKTPSQPDPLRKFSAKLSPALRRARQEQALKAVSRGESRVFDPDEKTSPRDVWMTYRPGPGFDFMEPVR